ARRDRTTRPGPAPHPAGFVCRCRRRFRPARRAPAAQAAPSAEGYLFPTTYLLPLRIGGRELVRVMTQQFSATWTPEWQARLDSLHFSRHELVTLASIIESEVRYDPDRPFISAVYHNRLRRGMRLEA